MSLIRARYRAVNTIMNLPTNRFVGFLDLFPNAAAAYSLRLLRKDYSGGLVRVRAWDGLANQGEADIMPYRVSSTEYVLDLNSTLENLDATAIGRGLTTSDTLADLVSTGVNDYDGLVSAWYGQQAGSSANAVQSTSTSQPKIVDAGALVTENGKPAIDFDGVDDYLRSSTSWGINGTISRSFFIVSKADANSILNSYLGIGDGTTAGNLDKWSISTEMGIRVYGAGVVYGSPSTNQALLTNIFEGTNINQNLGYINGSLSAVTSSGSGVINTNDTFNNIGANGANTSYMDGNIQEVIAFASNKTTVRTSIETNINTFYSIYP